MREKGLGLFEWKVPHRLFRLYVPFLMLTFLVGYYVDRAAANRDVQILRTDLSERAARSGIGIERSFAEYIQVSRGVEAAIAANGDITEAEFSAIASNLWRNSPGIINIAAAPDNVVRFVYPFEGNASAIGLDHRKQGAQIGAIDLAHNSRKPVVAGPVDLVQGGSGFIIRTPVFVQDVANEPEKFWGTVSVVVSTTQIFREAGLQEYGRDTDVAIRGANGTGAEGAMVFGDPSVFQGDPVVFNLGSRFGSWQIGLVPNGGWPAHAESYKFLWFIVTFVGAILMLAVMAFDASRNRRRLAQRQLEDAIEIIDGGFAIYDAKDRLVMCNSKYKDIYQKSQHLLVPGSTFSEIIRDGLAKGQYPEALGQEDEWFEKRIKAHRLPNSEVLQKTDDGRWLKISERRTPDGYTVGFRVDITELVEAREAAEAADRAKSQFLDTINHEMRTPLTVLLGYNSFLINPEYLPSYKPLMASLSDDTSGTCQRMNCATALLGDVAGFAKKARLSGQSLLALVNETLDISAMNAGRLKLELEAVPVRKLGQLLTAKFSGDAEAKRIDFRCDFGGQVAFADRQRLIQTLEHLVANALKFTETGTVHMTSQTLGSFVVFQIQDTGCGIAESEKVSIFKSFDRSDASETRKFGGAGIGLALCKKLVELHGGTMSVASEIGKGSTFTFSIPLWTKPDTVRMLSAGDANIST